MIRVALAAAAAVGVLGCASASAPIPVPPGGSIAVEALTALEFQRQAEDFYGRLIKRRFNALETFNDDFLRDHFRTPDGFFDYYAGLATALQEAHFSKSRPSYVGVEEFLFETPNTVRVQVRYQGQDSRPLRGLFKVDLILSDTWVLADRAWSITPGRL